MCEETDQDKENARLLLQLYHERNNQLANMLIALNGFMLAFIAGLITFVGSTFFSAPSGILNCSKVICNCVENSRDPIPVILAINIAIVVMIFWRIYSHYIDDDIVKGYRKIITIEDFLGIQFKEMKCVSLRFGFDRDENKKIQTTKVEKIDFASRGHTILDTLAFICCIYLLYFENLLIDRSGFNGWLVIFSILIIIAISTIPIYCRYKKNCRDIRNLNDNKKSQKSILCNDTTIIILLMLILMEILLLFCNYSARTMSV